MGQVKIWCNAEFTTDAMEMLRKGIGKHELVFSSSRGNNLSTGTFSAEMENAQVAFGQPDPDQVMRLDALEYVQVTSAGYTRYDTEAFRAHVSKSGLRFCNSSSVFDGPCAQHLLAFMLALARQIPAAVAEQNHGAGWIFDRLRPAVRVLHGDKALILGYGAIGKRLIELLAPFHLEITALRRSPRGDETVPTFPITEISKHLADADHVIDILPANDSTAKLINRDRFAEMKRGAAFYNIGRGTTVDSFALVDALGSGQLGAALLDVTDPEPLPPDHPLWRAPNCIITPHIAGGFQGEDLALVNHFLENLRRFEAGHQLCDEVF